MSDNSEWTAFEKTYKRILSDIIPAKPELGLEETMDWIRQVFDYNVPHGKRNRGLTVVSTFRLIAEQQKRTFSEEDLELARVLGWVVEILQAYFLVVDDLTDQSITRRGQTCWYKLEHVGLISCNDAILIDQTNYFILKTYFSNKKYYLKLLDLMHEVTRLTAYGQCMDLASNPPNKRPQFEVFTKLRYDNIIKYKTAFYSFVLPVRLAMYMSGCDSEKEHMIAEEILLKIGHLYQEQDDYLDCFGDPAIIGKIGTDIEEGKCSWLAMTAFNLGDSKQKEILKENIGYKDGDCVRRVKAVYNELNLNDVFKREEEDLYKDICRAIDGLKDKSELNPRIFIEYLDKIYRRNK